MTKLDDRQAAAHAGYVAGLLAPGKVRRAALSCIVTGDTPELLRKIARLRIADLEAVWLAWAEEIERLAAHGITGQTARDGAKIALALNDTTADSFRQPEGYQEVPWMRARVLAVADEMDALLTEGFDAAVYAKELEQAAGGAR